VLDRSRELISHHRFLELPQFLRAGDVLVLNTSTVLPARLYGKKSVTGGRVECLLVHRVAEDRWEVMLGGSHIKSGLQIDFSADDIALHGVVEEHAAPETWFVRFSLGGDEFDAALDCIGHTPIPPYIKDHGMDEQALRQRYQTVYADPLHTGSVAAPTAGLHFTKEMLDMLKERGIEVCTVMLHVGIGTFAPVKVDDIAHHKMHAEFTRVPVETAAIVNRAKADGRRVIAVGTTTARTLESFIADGVLQSGERWTDIFITPGYAFQCIDGLVTNFHLPRSTLLMLVSAFAGREFVLRAYAEAVRERYRFYSFGDVMFIA
jgi:S-adenosylmethionine:tRNA ribosyltransferase-isomerase